MWAHYRRNRASAALQLAEAIHHRLELAGANNGGWDAPVQHETEAEAATEAEAEDAPVQHETEAEAADEAEAEDAPVQHEAEVEAANEAEAEDAVQHEAEVEDTNSDWLSMFAHGDSYASMPPSPCWRPLFTQDDLHDWPIWDTDSRVAAYCQQCTIWDSDSETW